MAKAMKARKAMKAMKSRSVASKAKTDKPMKAHIFPMAHPNDARNERHVATEQTTRLQNKCPSDSRRMHSRSHSFVLPQHFFRFATKQTQINRHRRRINEEIERISQDRQRSTSGARGRDIISSSQGTRLHA